MARIASSCCVAPRCLPRAEFIEADAAANDCSGEFLNGCVFFAYVKNDLTVVHDDVSVAHLECMVQVVRHQNARHALGLELAEVGEQRFGGADSEPTSWRGERMPSMVTTESRICDEIASIFFTFINPSRFVISRPMKMLRVIVI